jgi:hypothetical protein
MMTNWKLISFDREGIGDVVACGALNELLSRSGPVLGLAHDDEEMAEQLLADLGRVGARYAEYIGGTLVVVPVER